MSGEGREEVDAHFSPTYMFHGPDGSEWDYKGLQSYFAAHSLCGRARCRSWAGRWRATSLHPVAAWHLCRRRRYGARSYVEPRRVVLAHMRAARAGRPPYSAAEVDGRRRCRHRHRFVYCGPPADGVRRPTRLLASSPRRRTNARGRGLRSRNLRRLLVRASTSRAQRARCAQPVRRNARRARAGRAAVPARRSPASSRRRRGSTVESGGRRRGRRLRDVSRSRRPRLGLGDACDYAGRSCLWRCAPRRCATLARLAQLKATASVVKCLFGLGLLLVAILVGSTWLSDTSHAPKARITASTI